jgi:hypothetical protein
MSPPFPDDAYLPEEEITICRGYGENRPDGEGWDGWVRAVDEMDDMDNVDDAELREQVETAIRMGCGVWVLSRSCDRF